MKHGSENKWKVGVFFFCNQKWKLSSTHTHGLIIWYDDIFQNERIEWFEKQTKKKCSRMWNGKKQKKNKNEKKFINHFVDLFSFLSFSRFFFVFWTWHEANDHTEHQEKKRLKDQKINHLRDFHWHGYSNNKLCVCAKRENWIFPLHSEKNIECEKERVK